MRTWHHSLLFRAAGLTLVVAILLWAMAGSIGEINRSPPTGSRPMRIVVANVWRENPDPLAAAKAILSQQADVVLVQEAGGLGRWLNLLKSRYYAATCPKTCSLHILSRYPLDQSDAGLRSLMPWRNRNTILEATALLPNGHKLRLVTVHIPRPFANQNGTAVRAALAAALRHVPRRDTLIAGDFNTAYLSPAMIRQDGMLSPLLRQTRIATYPARISAGPLSVSWPFPLVAIDHLYTTEQWSTIRLRRLTITGSDHFGLVADIVRSR